MTLSQYLSRGATSRGVLSIRPISDMDVSKVPVLQMDGDIKAVVQGIDDPRHAPKSDSNLKLISPPDYQTSADYVKEVGKICMPDTSLSVFACRS